MKYNKGFTRNVEVPSEQPSVNYRSFRDAYKALQARRAAEGKLVMHAPFNARIK